MPEDTYLQLSSSTPLREKFLVGPSNEHSYVLGMIEAAVVYKGATTTERYHLARNLNEQLPGSGIIEKLELLGIKLFSLSRATETNHGKASAFESADAERVVQSAKPGSVSSSLILALRCVPLPLR
ncbi:hypothetical protein HPB50_007199 [Hyalomma asiaticum]|uniref:Uncharacterized protein n=1 Tax=Hyalomma asiaticum TaxID=266040 RepID=A0ACB7SU50_HYAAI|nr:hypothetical protein HPB50_007199 [Hyalomma asiaticum]